MGMGYSFLVSVWAVLEGEQAGACCAGARAGNRDRCNKDSRAGDAKGAGVDWERTRVLIARRRARGMWGCCQRSPDLAQELPWRGVRERGRDRRGEQRRAALGVTGRYIAGHGGFEDGICAGRAMRARSNRACACQKSVDARDVFALGSTRCESCRRPPSLPSLHYTH